MWDRTENQITLVMIRHGLTRSNEEHRYLGKKDEELSKNGKLKLYENKKRKYYPDIDILFSSPMKRCVQTASILYPQFNPFLITEWEEMDFGLFEGKNYMDLQGDEQYQAWIDSNGTLPFPEGESREEFISRCELGFEKMMAEIKENSQKDEISVVGMIVHGGIIMALLSKYGDGDYFDYQTANGEGYICVVKDHNEQPGISEIKKI